MRTYRYYVTGPGQFPEDMLRYDRARIVKSFPREDTKRTWYEIEGQTEPTHGRWQSFLWVVVDDTIKCNRWGLPELEWIS